MYLLGIFMAAASDGTGKYIFRKWNKKDRQGSGATTDQGLELDFTYCIIIHI